MACSKCFYLCFVREGWNELLIAGFSHQSVLSSDSILLAMGLHIYRNTAQQVGIGSIFDRILSELVSKMREMAMDKSELGCLRAIVLFNPGKLAWLCCCWFPNTQWDISVFDCFCLIIVYRKIIMRVLLVVGCPHSPVGQLAGSHSRQTRSNWPFGLGLLINQAIVVDSVIILTSVQHIHCEQCVTIYILLTGFRLLHVVFNYV